MALNDTIKALVKDAIGLTVTYGIGGTCDYGRVTAGTYDPTTSTANDSTTTYSNIPATFTRFNYREVMDDASIDAKTDEKVLIASNDLAVEPAMPDYIVIGSDRWDVIKLLGVPGGSLYIVHVRKISA